MHRIRNKTGGVCNLSYVCLIAIFHLLMASSKTIICLQVWHYDWRWQPVKIVTSQKPKAKFYFCEKCNNHIQCRKSVYNFNGKLYRTDIMPFK